MSAAPLVRVERSGGVAFLTLDNPPVNAMCEPLLEQLGVVVAELAGEAETRVVVITGAGEKTFAAGADLRELRGILGDRVALEHHTALTRRVLGDLAALPQPTIAAVGAPALGGGFELLMCCDLAVVDERASVGLPEVKLGLIPGAGGTQRLPRRIGLAAAARLILLGDTLTAPEALQLGAISEVVPAGRALERAGDLARRLADGPSLALRGAKAALRDGLEIPLEEGLEAERAQFIGVALSEDATLGVDAFVARETPVFRQR